MREERMQILKMVEEGKLSAAEAARLLEAMEQSAAPEAPASPPRFLRVRVHDPRSDRRRVDVRVPWGIASTVLALASSLPIRGLDLAQLRSALERGERGRIVEVEGDEGRVEIFLE